ncbi:MAG: heme exporter protein CcmB [Chloroflexi bacterium]|nr:heme exporter protein CcmB [Chloroflexota bacterium]
MLAKDLLLEFRAREIVVSLLVFALLTIIIFSFAFEPGPDRIGIVAPGVLWVAFTFAGVLGLNRAFVQEKDSGCLQGLMLCPVDREAIYFGKMLASFIFMFIMEIIIMPVFSIFLNLPIFMPWLLLIAFLATIGFVAVGTIFSAIAVNTKARDLMLPLLFFPVVVPVLIAAVKSSAIVLAGSSLDDLWPWLQMIAAFDAIFLVISALIFQYALEE